jgi:hypothetical protein
MFRPQVDGIRQLEFSDIHGRIEKIISIEPSHIPLRRIVKLARSKLNQTDLNPLKQKLLDLSVELFLDGLVAN